MYRQIVYLAFVLLVASCTPVRRELTHPGEVFSFSDFNLPSLGEIDQQKFQERMPDGLVRLTNVHGSFDRVFTFLYDERRNIYLIKDKLDRTVYYEAIQGIPRYIAALDIDADGDPDVILDLAQYGNRGNGTESFMVLLNENRRLNRLNNPIQFVSSLGQEHRAGVLTWYADEKVCAKFFGEETTISGRGTPDDPLIHGPIIRVEKVWGHKDGRLQLIHKSSIPITRQEVKFLTFR